MKAFKSPQANSRDASARLASMTLESTALAFIGKPVDALLQPELAY
jgi:hypothetical protein